MGIYQTGCCLSTSKGRLTMIPGHDRYVQPKGIVQFQQLWRFRKIQHTIKLCFHSMGTKLKEIRRNGNIQDAIVSTA